MKGVKVDDIKTLYEGLIHGTENVHPEVSPPDDWDTSTIINWDTYPTM